MEQAITIRTDNHFKSKALNDATMNLYKAFTAVVDNNKEACRILARIEKGKTYKEDGFKSLADYAEQIGLEKSAAHKMENAGRLLIAEDKTIREFADKADYSKLSILASADGSDLKKGIEDGSLKPDMTQAQVKDWKASKAKAKTVKVLRDYEVHIVFGDNLDTLHYDCIALEAIPELEGFVKVGAYSPILPNGEVDEKTRWNVCVNPASGEMLRYTAAKPAEEVKPAKRPSGTIDVSKLSTAQIETLLAELARRQGEGE